MTSTVHSGHGTAVPPAALRSVRPASAPRPYRAFGALALCTALSLAATSARAGLVVVTSASRSIVAETTDASPSAAAAVSTTGVFDDAVSSPASSGGVVFALAAQDSDINTPFFSGSSKVAVGSDAATSASAESTYALLFSVTGDFGFRAFVDMGSNGNGASQTAFELFQIGADGASTSMLSAVQAIPIVDGTLGSGNYGLSVRASSSASGVDQVANSFFRFSVSFFDLFEPPSDPPNDPHAVPEPQTLALALAGLLAAATARRSART